MVCGRQCVCGDDTGKARETGQETKHPTWGGPTEARGAALARRLAGDNFGNGGGGGKGSERDKLAKSRDRGALCQSENGGGGSDRNNDTAVGGKGAEGACEVAGDGPEGVSEAAGQVSDGEGGKEAGMGCWSKTDIQTAHGKSSARERRKGAVENHIGGRGGGGVQEQGASDGLCGPELLCQAAGKRAVRSGGFPGRHSPYAAHALASKSSKLLGAQP